MRIVKVIAHPYFRITLFAYQGKYQIKIEDELYEEHIKLQEGEIDTEQESTLIKTLESWDYTSFVQRFQSLHQARIAILQSLSNEPTL